jgi:protein-disulfide isomerase
MAGSVRPAKDQGPTVTLSKTSGGKGPGGKGGGPKKPYVNQSRARLEAQRKQRNRRVMIGVLGVVVIGAIIGVIVAATGGSSKAKPVVVPAAVNGTVGTFTTGTGPVLVEQYGDFQCPHCEEWYKTVEKPAVHDLLAQNKITFAFHNFPFIGSESFTEANAAACASDAAPADFWKMHDYLYDHQAAENSGFWNTSQLQAALETIGANTPATEACVKSNKYGSWVKQQATLAAKRGVTATPTVYVNNQLVSDNSTPAALQAAVTAAEAAKK